MKRMKKYDVIIVGAGPAGIFCAYELVKNREDLNILILEKGRGMDKRNCPKHTNGGKCVHCKPCNITTGWAGAGAFSDGKLSLSPEVGGTLPEYLGVEETIKLIKYTDEVYLDFGVASDIHGELLTPEMEKIRKKDIEANLKLVHCPVRHLGTEKAQELYKKLYDFVTEKGVEVHFNSAVENLILEDDKIKGVKNGKGDYLADIVMISVGLDGADWLMKECSKESISTEVGVVDIGVRLECRNEVMKDINDNFYEAKLIHCTHTFDDKVRTFCSNPGGFVSSEYYDDNLDVVNGHSFKDLKSDNTNFALLVSQKFTEPFKAPIEYGKHIARLANYAYEQSNNGTAIWRLTKRS